MPKLNLFLSADVEVEPSNIIFNQSLLAPEPTLRTKAQRKALHCILSNVGKYKSQPHNKATAFQDMPETGTATGIQPARPWESG